MTISTTRCVRTLTAATARRLLDAAAGHAQLLGKPFCVSVLDSSGVLTGFLRMDGAPLHSEQVSRDKAYTAVGYRAPSEVWFDRAKPFGDSGVAIVTAAVDRLVPMAGGVPIIVDAELVGAIGVSGGTAAEDKQVAEAAVTAVLTAPATATPTAVTGYFAALRAGDPDAWAACFAEDAVGHDPVGTPARTGRDAFRDMLTGFLPRWRRFDGLFETDAWTAGNATVVRWTGSGISPTGRPVRWSGVNTYLLDDDGLINTLYAVFDADALAAQLNAQAEHVPDVAAGLKSSVAIN
jgi:uncharacterized protein GlcG (DUF336 family)/ketosteroid isomerase-like protein